MSAVRTTAWLSLTARGLSFLNSLLLVKLVLPAIGAGAFKFIAAILASAGLITVVELGLASNLHVVAASSRAQGGTQPQLLRSALSNALVASAFIGILVGATLIAAGHFGLLGGKPTLLALGVAGAFAFASVTANTTSKLYLGLQHGATAYGPAIFGHLCAAVVLVCFQEASTSAAWSLFLVALLPPAATLLWHVALLESSKVGFSLECVRYGVVRKMLSVSALPWACQGISAALVVVPVMLAIAVGTPEAVAGTFAVHKVATASSVTTMLLVQPLWAEYVVLREQGRNATLMQTFTASLRRTLTVAVIFVVAVVAGANMINGWLHLSVSRSTYALAMVWAGVQGLRYTCLMLLLGTNHLRGVAVGSAAAVILTCVCTSFLPVESPTSIFAWVLIVDIALLLQHLQQVLFYFRLKIRPSDG